MVVDEHDVAELLDVFLHVLLGGVDLRLGRGDVVGAIVLDVEVADGLEHTVCFEELREVGLGDIANHLGQVQIVLGTAAGTLVDGVGAHLLEEVGVEVVVVVLHVEVKVQLCEHAGGAPDVASEPWCLLGEVVEDVHRQLATHGAYALLEGVDVGEGVVGTLGGSDDVDDALTIVSHLM